MATPKTGRLIAARMVAPDTRLLTVELVEPLGYRGGQYVIVDSGLVHPSGKAVKRAYSILGADREQQRIEIAVKRIEQGMGSDFMHGLEVGAELRFSGPWGKLLVAPEVGGETFLLASDTGISATLGLLQAERFEPLLADTTLIWLRTAADYFLPEDDVRARIPAACGAVQITALPPIAHPERVPYALSFLHDQLARGPIARAFACGDGDINYALLDALLAAGIAATRDHLESFFNMPKKSA